MSSPEWKPIAKPRYMPTAVHPTFIHTLLSNLWKDLCLEWRSKDAINAMLFFALLVAVIFSFAFEPTPEEARQMVGGLVWVAVLFASIVALNQSWARELRNQALDGYRVSRASPNALFLGKAIGNFIFVGALELVIAPLFIVFFNLRALGSTAMLIVVFAAGTWAVVINGTFFGAMSLRTRSRELMLPLLLFPISIPAVLAMVNATTAVLTGEGGTRLPLDFLIVYDIVFTTVCFLLFETVLHAE